MIRSKNFEKSNIKNLDSNSEVDKNQSIDNDISK